MLRRDKEENGWPVFRVPDRRGNLPAWFVNQHCLPLIRAVAGEHVKEEELTAIARSVHSKKAVEVASPFACVLVTRRLQKFHTMLAMLWSLAYSVTSPQEFDFMVCSLEILLAASLLEN